VNKLVKKPSTPCLALSAAQFVPAQAKIPGSLLIISTVGVAAPKAVRYGWANVPDVNLFNQYCLPASPFRTDAD
jgi:sialate O-acetylesterase